MDIPLMFLCLAAFVAGFIDSIVGGGGFVQVPAFFILYPQLAVPYVIGTNRVASAVGTSVAALNYWRQIRVPWKVVLFAAAGAGVAAYTGALLQSRIPSAVLKPLILCVIVVIAAYTYRNKSLGQEERLKVLPDLVHWYALGIGLVMGLYNGLIGPGTGSLLVFSFVGVIGYHFLSASAVSKVVNVAADVCSLVFFFAHKYILFHIALPMMICNMTGSYLGSRMAMLRGNTFVRQVFLAVIAATIARFAWDVFGYFMR